MSLRRRVILLPLPGESPVSTYAPLYGNPKKPQEAEPHWDRTGPNRRFQCVSTSSLLSCAGDLEVALSHSDRYVFGDVLGRRLVATKTSKMYATKPESKQNRNLADRAPERGVSA